MQGIKCGPGCVYVCVITKQISSIQLLVSVCVCNRSAPGSAYKTSPLRCVCVRTHARSRVGTGVCMSVIITRPSTASCVCMYVYVC